MVEIRRPAGTPVLTETAESTRNYRRPKDKLSFGDTKIAELVYGFYKNRFCSVGFRYDSSQSKDVFAALTGTCGKPDVDEEIRHEGRRVEWTWKTVMITFTERSCDIYHFPERLKLREKETAKHLESKRK